MFQQQGLHPRTQDRERPQPWLTEICFEILDKINVEFYLSPQIFHFYAVSGKTFAK